MSPIVLDSSIVLSWCFDDDSTGVADETFVSLTNRERWMPPLLSIEVANQLVLAEKKKKLSKADALAFVAELQAYSIQADDESDYHVFRDTSDLARKYGLTAYDASYLELAMRKGAVLATLDMDLRRAAVKAGVPVVTVPK